MGISLVGNANYNFIEYSENYSKTFGSLWQCYIDEPIIDNEGNIIDFPDDPDSASFKYKEKLTGQTRNNGRKDIEIMVPLKCLSNFWRNLEMPLINCEINIFATWSEKSIILTGDYANNVDNKPQFEVTDKKLYVPIVTLPTPDNGKLLQQLKHVLREQLTGIKINQNQKYIHKTDI